MIVFVRELTIGQRVMSQSVNKFERWQEWVTAELWLWVTDQDFNPFTC